MLSLSYSVWTGSAPAVHRATQWRSPWHASDTPLAQAQDSEPRSTTASVAALSTDSAHPLSGQDCNASRAAQGIVGCLMGCGLSTAPLLPGGRQRLVLPCHRVSTTSSLDLSPRARDRCADNSAVRRELEELRRESYIILWVIRSTMKIVTLSLSSLSLSSGHATCDM